MFKTIKPLKMKNNILIAVIVCLTSTFISCNPDRKEARDVDSVKLNDSTYVFLNMRPGSGEVYKIDTFSISPSRYYGIDKSEIETIYKGEMLRIGTIHMAVPSATARRHNDAPINSRLFLWGEKKGKVIYLYEIPSAGGSAGWALFILTIVVGVVIGAFSYNLDTKDKDNKVTLVIIIGLIIGALFWWLSTQIFPIGILMLSIYIVLYAGSILLGWFNIGRP